ncbi:MAG: MotA/TolQ/ExbB proton channel family protein [Prevotella sp.]|nr:MotA/TolQ/ExbB proton channel family protein [Prevotella sp.]
MESIKVHLISIDPSVDNPLINKVVDTINSYLLRNKGAVSDFNLIKDIVERNCDAVDEEINQQLPIPIYLGLMGTVLGIILGLWSINFVPKNFMVSVTDLIESVKWAMGCSFMGLLLTTILSAWFYRGAKAKLEEQKNELYTFIQIELLPQLSQDANSTILTMQSHLEKFNEGFSKNVSSFDSIMIRILKVFDSQVKLNEQLKDMDISQVASLNKNTLVELRKSMTEFEKFNQYLNLMNSFVQKTAMVTDSVNNQLRRTEDVKNIVLSMEENIENNRLVMEKLQNFLQKVEARNALVTATASLEDTLTEAIDQLKKHVQEEINAIQTHTSQASQDLDRLMQNERGHLDKLKNLDDLGKLQQVVQSVNAMKTSFDNQNNTLSKQIEQLSQAITGLRSNNTITASIGLPPIVLWLVSGLIGLAAILFIVGNINQMFTNDSTLVSSPNDNYIEQAIDTTEMEIDSVAIELQ